MEATPVIEMNHENCARCIWLAEEALNTAMAYSVPSWASIDGKHGAVAMLDY